MAASEETLDQLHELVAKQLSVLVADEPSAALLGVAVTFLKLNPVKKPKEATSEIDELKLLLSKAANTHKPLTSEELALLGG